MDVDCPSGRLIAHEAGQDVVWRRDDFENGRAADELRMVIWEESSDEGYSLVESIAIWRTRDSTFHRVDRGSRRKGKGMGREGYSRGSLHML